MTVWRFDGTMPNADTVDHRESVTTVPRGGAGRLVTVPGGGAGRLVTVPGGGAGRILTVPGGGAGRTMTRTPID